MTQKVKNAFPEVLKVKRFDSSEYRFYKKKTTVEKISNITHFNFYYSI